MDLDLPPAPFAMSVSGSGTPPLFAVSRVVCRAWMRKERQGRGNEEGVVGKEKGKNKVGVGDPEEVAAQQRERSITSNLKIQIGSCIEDALVYRQIFKNGKLKSYLTLQPPPKKRRNSRARQWQPAGV
ncbi:hypothetical protein E2542_SST03810 [Spatholobus suberectus]|nr:hypothetical protein E2542_SST03810 [Spatholobus suberectus]